MSKRYKTTIEVEVVEQDGFFYINAGDSFYLEDDDGVNKFSLEDLEVLGVQLPWEDPTPIGLTYDEARDMVYGMYSMPARDKIYDYYKRLVDEHDQR